MFKDAVIARTPDGAVVVATPEDESVRTLNIGDEVEYRGDRLVVDDIVSIHRDDINSDDLRDFVDPYPERFLKRFSPAVEYIAFITLAHPLEDLFDNDDPTYEKIYRSSWDD